MGSLSLARGSLPCQTRSAQGAPRRARTARAQTRTVSGLCPRFMLRCPLLPPSPHGGPAFKPVPTLGRGEGGWWWFCTYMPGSLPA